MPPAKNNDYKIKSTRGIRAVNLCTAFGSAGLLFASFWPGYAAGSYIFLVLLLIGVLGLCWLSIAMRQLSEKHRSPHITPLQVITAPILVCLTYLLLKFYVPRRVAFLLCQGQFDRCVASAPVSDNNGLPLDRSLGIYHIDRYAADPAGGVYFRTGSQPEFLSPDTFSYGFVYKPNRRQTPFGRSSYMLHPITKDWYWFQVRD